MSVAGAPRSFWEDVRAMGRELDRERIAQSFALCEGLDFPSAGTVAIEDLAYGPHERHRIDLYRPQRDGSGRALLLFVHGGGYASGDKRMGPFFANLGRWAAGRNLVCATMNYRLAPDYGWPSAQDDIRAAIAWLAAHADHYGADASKLFLMGHSAGAGHSAAFSVSGSFEASTLAGLILISGTYDLLAAGKFGHASRALYYGDDESLYATRSSAGFLKDLSCLVSVVVAEFDPPELQEQALIALAALSSGSGPAPQLTRLLGHNHYTEILSAGAEPGRQLHDALLHFITSVTTAS